MRCFLSAFLLSLGLSACFHSPSPETLAKFEALKEKTTRQLTPIQGGTFLMGDFCKEHGFLGMTEENSGFPCTGEEDDPAHEVTLSDFRMFKNKVTYADFDVYSEMHGETKIDEKRRTPDDGYAPAVAITVPWKKAQSYCQWIGESIGKTLSLPSEAQWEYAARDNGKFKLFSTDNGLYEPPRNIVDITTEQRESIPPLQSTKYIVGQFPSMPNGLMDFENKEAWVLDNYSDSFYLSSPANDPVNLTPPDEEKVYRHANSWGRITERAKAAQHRSRSFRCVENP